MKNTEALSIYKLLEVNGVGPSLTNKVIKELINENIYLNTLTDFENASKYLSKLLKKEQISSFVDHHDMLLGSVAELEKQGAEYITIRENQYPRHLAYLLKTSSPPVLSYKGNLNLLNNNKSVGFCGSRKASSKGLEVTRDCAAQLVENNVTVVSGYASGVDQMAHKTVLENNGTTIIVLPEGLLHFKIRKALEDVWDWQRILVVSEFSPNAGWTASRAMGRNKTIIGLSGAIILIEAGKNGGSMAAGKDTLKTGKSLFAPIYEGMPDFAVGNRILLEEGAKGLKKNRDTGKANLNEVFNAIFGNPKTEKLNEQLSILP